MSEPSASGAPLALDPAVLREFYEDLGAASANDLLESLRDDLPRRLNAILACDLGSDLALLGRHAHALKGTSYSFGATALGDCARELEQAASHGDATNAARLRPLIAAQINGVIDALALLLDGDGTK
jgi:HPt (histidine-containing phosphotransfer) domain-containing protein